MDGAKIQCHSLLGSYFSDELSFNYVQLLGSDRKIRPDSTFSLLKIWYFNC